MAEEQTLREQAEARSMAPRKDGLWESLEFALPEIGVPQRHGDGDCAMVPVRVEGMHVVTEEDAATFFSWELEMTVGTAFHRVVWRDATAEEMPALLEREAAEAARWKAFDELRDTWQAIRARFLETGKPFPGKRFPDGEPVLEVVDDMWGNYYVVLQQKKWMWWVQFSPVATEESTAGDKADCVAYRLPWEDELATKLRQTPPMPDFYSWSE